MDWSDDGIVLSARPHGESGVILALLTPGHGRHLGLVRGGTSRRLRGVLQPGNGVRASWRARLADHLGSYTVELQCGRAGSAMEDPFALAGLAAACAVASIVPEREAHPALYEGFELVLDALEEPDIWPALLVRWELGLLQELGFGLDLSACAATGARGDLIYVSPKSGRAVSRIGGEPYKDRLLALPGFLAGAQAGAAGAPAAGIMATAGDINDGLRLTGIFLERHLFGPAMGHLPDARIRLAAHLMARAKAA